MCATAIANPNQSLCDLSITRIFNAPRELVFDAFSNPEHAKQWMGPRGFAAIYVEQDVRPGGKWRACLHQTDDRLGKKYPDLWQRGIFHEIVRPERVVYTFAWEGQGGQPTRETLITITFEALRGGKTQMDFYQASFDSFEQRDGHDQGWNSSFDRLADYVRLLG
jgi:uncharacterized protein YndB with AHSA1/START domain